MQDYCQDEGDTVRPKAYSYVRFSTPEQAKGDSYRRQLEKAQRYAIEHGLELDDNETFFDKGVSAFSGSNAIDGQLGAFRRAVEMGDIDPGSYLLVENLDRLSRMAAWEASTLLGSIVQLGITIVALSDNQVYSRDTLSRDPHAMLMMVIGFMRSHQESAYKSERLREAWSNKKALARSEGRPMTAHIPAWLDLSNDRQSITINSERAAVVRELFSRTLEGVSQTRLAAELNERGLSTWGKGKRQGVIWHRSYVHKILKNDAVIGVMTPHTFRKVNGKPIREPLASISDYYPAVIERDQFDAVQRLLSAKAPPQRQSAKRIGHTVSSFVAGLAKCPQCGSTMTRVNKGKKGGTPYLVCTKAKARGGCEYVAVKLGPVEQALVSERSWLLAQMPSKRVNLDEEAEAVQQGIEACDEAIGHLLAEIRQGSVSQAVRSDLERVEQERAVLSSRLDELATDMLKATGRTLARLADELETALGAEVADPTAVNTALRALVSSVVVAYRTGNMDVYWKHSPDAAPASLKYAWEDY